MGKKKLTNEEIKKRIFDLVGDEYTKLEDSYKNASTKFSIRHNKCGHEYMVSWNSFRQGSRCPKCAMLARKNKLALTNEDIVKAMYELVGNEYTKMDENYTNNQTKFKIKHNVCGYEYETIWGSFQQGSRCPKCAGCYKYTDSEISKLVSEMTNGEYTKQSEYKNSKTKFKIKHNICGCVYEVKWDNFQTGKRCPKCAREKLVEKLSLNNETVIRAIYELVGDEYTKLDNVYVNAHTKFKIRHNVCGNSYEVSWSNFQSGYRCPKCNQSKGEKFISDYLTNQHISFTAQIRFSDCKYKNTLPFDFAILDSEMRVKALIEYDGKQHFEPIEIWGGEEALKEVQLRDSIKNQYCKDNNIPLLRIRYDEQDISKVIEEFIAQEKVS